MRSGRGTVVSGRERRVLVLGGDVATDDDGGAVEGSEVEGCDTARYV
jgi:hypothetical protein